MYSIKEILNNVCKERERTTNIQQSRVMIPRRGLPSLEAMEDAAFPFPITSSSDVNGSSGDGGSLTPFFNEQRIDIRMESNKMKLPSRGNGQQLPRNLTGQQAEKPVRTEVRSTYSYQGYVYKTMQCPFCDSNHVSIITSAPNI